MLVGKRKLRGRYVIIKEKEAKRERDAR